MILGEGNFGRCSLITLNGGKKVVLKDGSAADAEYKDYSREARVMQTLAGAGGAPLALGLWENPAILMSYKGSKNLLDFMN